MVAFVRLCIAVVSLTPLGAYADPATVRVGVLAFRDLAATEQQWSPVADYLSERLPDYRFTVEAMYLDQLADAVANRQVDFVLNQPEHYVLLRTRYGLTAVATLNPRIGRHASARLGGVIFTRDEQSDIQQIRDLKGKRIAAAHPNSFGGYRVQQWALYQSGLELPDDAKEMMFTGLPQDQVVARVLSGQADAGFVRTGLLESLVDEGRLDLRSIKVINPQQSSHFPLLHSTELFPEWPFSAVRDMPASLLKQVTLALLELPPGHPAALRAKIDGFAPPADYSRLESVMLEMGSHPDRIERIAFEDIAHKYWLEILLALSGLLAAAVAVLVFLARSRQHVRRALNERASLLDSLGEGVYGIDRDGTCTFINPKALEILGWKADEVIGKDQHSLFHHHHPDGRVYAPEDCPVRKTLADGKRRQGEEWFFRKDGHGFPVHYSVTPVNDGSFRESVVVTFRDISDEHHADELIRIAAIAFEAQEAMVVTDARSRILRVNRAFTEVTGYSAEEAVGQTPALLRSGYHEDSFYQEMWTTLSKNGFWRGEIWNKRKNGQIYPEWLTISAVHNPQGVVTHYISSFLDITQRKEAEEQIEFLALYDPLTHLPNRRLLTERVAKAVAGCSSHQRHAALLFVDIDNFKLINDAMGHDIGDQLLRQAALRLRDTVRSHDTVARLGGDEFVILIEELSPDYDEARQQIEAMGQKMLATLGHPFRFGDYAHHCTASIGAIPFVDGDATLEMLLKAADMAMYKAKAAGKNRLCFFDPAMQTEIETRALLERELRQAIEHQQFALYLQAQVGQRGELLGAEALIRWQHPLRGVVAPGEFIEIAEETHLILPIGAWVLNSACQLLADWQRHPASAHLTLAINVSALQFRNSDFVDDVAAAIRLSGAQPDKLKLEITESLLLEDIEGAITRMAALKAELGVSLSLDDFGTGYSSLSYLKQLPLDQIKIDRSFIRDIDQNPNDAAIAEAVIALGESFSLNVIAEGVETAAQRDALIERGCHAFQGYLFGKPVPAAQFLNDWPSAQSEDGRRI